jgi:glycosyltransferase involved in cell wall biosynthesis
MKPSWSVVLIAKNEAKTLPRLMASLKEFQLRGGEVILLDTGSEDGTPEVAGSLGCKVTTVGSKFVTTLEAKTAEAVNEMFVRGEEPSIVAEGNRFFRYADARNYAAGLASNDMVSMPDCDEEYTSLNLEAIERYIADGFGQLEFMFVFAHDAYGNEAIKFRQCKFYNRKQLRWKGIIHEILKGTARATLLPENVLKLEHWQNPNQERSRYLPGLALACYQEPNDDRNCHYLGRELTWTNRPKSAMAVLQRHIDMKKWEAERAQSMIFMGDCCGQLNRPHEQAEWYHRAFHLDSSRREALIRLAGFYRHNNQPKPCAAYAAAALEIPWHPFYANHVAHYRQEPHELMYWALGWMGDIKGAQEHLLKALEYLPHHPPYLRDTQYYFEYPDQGIDGWMRFDELQWLYNTAKSMDSVVELGSWKGRSTHALASGCRLGHVTAIDHFRGSVGEEGVHREAQTEAVYEQFCENTKSLTNLTVVRKDSQAAAGDFEDGSFDLVFIDADHTYAGVKRDIEAWRPKARIMLAGHDYCPEWPGVRQAVDETVGEVRVVGTIWYKLLREPLVNIVIPTLGRPDKLNRCLQAIRENAEYENYTVRVMPDDPDQPLGVPRLLRQATLLDYAWLMYLGNDCAPEKGFLREAVYSMLRHFPDGSGLIGLNDGYWNGEVATHWLAGPGLHGALGGEYFHEGYHHVGCDNELTERCRQMGKYHWEPRAVVHHDHPVLTGQPVEQADEVYRRGWKHREADLALLKERSEQLGFPFRTEFRKPVIPRRIFSIWLSKDGTMPPLVERCLRSQRLPGYEHHLITLGNCYRDDYVERAIAKGQWARAADYLRLHYINQDGGIYLDADMEVLKPFPDDMLVHQLFVGREENGYLGNSVIGARKGHSVLERCLERMVSEHGEDELVFEAGMQIWTEEAYRTEHRNIYPSSVFFPYNHQTGETNITPDTILFHHFMKTWKKEGEAA